MNKEKDSIIRYCKPSQIDEDGCVMNLAFLLRKKDVTLPKPRPNDETDLSVYHYEYFKNEPFKGLKALFDGIHFDYKKNGCFAVLKYSAAKKDIKNTLSLDIDIKDDGIPHYLQEYLLRN